GMAVPASAAGWTVAAGSARMRRRQRRRPAKKRGRTGRRCSCGVLYRFCKRWKYGLLEAACVPLFRALLRLPLVLWLGFFLRLAALPGPQAALRGTGRRLRRGRVRACACRRSSLTRPGGCPGLLTGAVAAVIGVLAAPAELDVVEPAVVAYLARLVMQSIARGAALERHVGIAVPAGGAPRPGAALDDDPLGVALVAEDDIDDEPIALQVPEVGVVADQLVHSPRFLAVGRGITLRVLPLAAVVEREVAAFELLQRPHAHVAHLRTDDHVLPRHADVLVADVEQAADLDDHLVDGAVAPDEDVLHLADLLVAAAADLGADHLLGAPGIPVEPACAPARELLPLLAVLPLREGLRHAEGR